VEPATTEAYASYLSGICFHPQVHFPHIEETCQFSIVPCTLAGMKKRWGNTPIKCKHPLCQDNLQQIVHVFPNLQYDDLLFITMTFTASFGMLQLGELTSPDNVRKHSAKKITCHYTLILSDTQFSFHLPYHKGDCFFEGNTVIMKY